MACTPQARAARSKGRKHCRKQVRMFVGIQVRDADAGRLQLANLRARLSFDFRRIKSAGESAGGERHSGRRGSGAENAEVREGNRFASRTGSPSISTT